MVTMNAVAPETITLLRKKRGKSLCSARTGNARCWSREGHMRTPSLYSRSLGVTETFSSQ